MFNWTYDKIRKLAGWIKGKSPPPIKSWADKNPKMFWTIIFTLWVIPLGLTAMFAFNAFLWLFYLR